MERLVCLGPLLPVHRPSGDRLCHRRRAVFAAAAADRRGPGHHAQPGTGADPSAQPVADRGGEVPHVSGRDRDERPARHRQDPIRLEVRPLLCCRLFQREHGPLLLPPPGHGTAAAGPRGDRARHGDAGDGTHHDRALARDLHVQGLRQRQIADGTEEHPGLGDRSDNCAPRRESSR